MPSSAPQIPAEAVEAAAKNRHEGECDEFGCVDAGRWEARSDEYKDRCRKRARLYIEAAYPHLLAAFAEKLLSDEALEVLATDLIGSGWDEASAHTVAQEMFGTRHPSVDDIDKARAAIQGDLREAIEAALASIESNGGADR